MDSNADTPKNQEDGSSSGRRKFIKMLGFAAGAGVATAAAVMPAASAPSDIGLDSPPAAVSRNAGNVKLDYDRQLLAHMCMMAELMREWYHINRDDIRDVCPEFEGDLYDFMVETRSSACAVARSAGIKLDRNYIAVRVAEYRGKAMGGMA